LINEVPIKHEEALKLLQKELKKKLPL